jgi:hypothetical protein
MGPPSISKFGIMENRKTRSNGLPTIDRSLSPGEPCPGVAEAAKTGEWIAGRMSIRSKGREGEGHAKLFRG